MVKNSHILYVEVRVARTDAAWPIIACLNELAFRIKIVNDRVCILLLRCREDHDLEVFIGSFETLPCKGSNIDTCQDRLWLLPATEEAAEVAAEADTVTAVPGGRPQRSGGHTH